MQSTINEYLTELDSQYQTGGATEHTYRPALQKLFATMLPHRIVSNEPARQACGAPDLILLRKEDNIPASFVEAKDIGDPDLAGRKKNKEQFNRYKRALDNIIFTDYLDFHLYEKGEFVASVRIAEIKSEKINAIKENFSQFEGLIQRFSHAEPQHIGSADQLAKVMADKARLMSDVFEKVLTLGNGNEKDEGNTLANQMAGFRDVLLHDITPKEFADVYAQTIAYGMFAARWRCTNPQQFNRHTIAELIPKTNPFLRQLFHYISGIDLDEQFRWVVDSLADIFRTADMLEVMKDFGQRTQQTDPIIHFYENFLSTYNPALRKSRGVWYTPPAVVSFIVRAVDDLLQTEFGLPMGLADTSKTNITLHKDHPAAARHPSEETEDIEVHRVQILDPAVGTGTFLVEVVDQIHKKFRGQSGLWQQYVPEHLIPRLNGFEILMAPYTMAHISIDAMLLRTYYNAINNERLRVYLTNSLQEHHPDKDVLFNHFIAQEANEASRIKRDMPLMVVMGNPPYSGESQNKNMGTWLEEQMRAYKTEPTGQKLREKNSKWLNNDYVKFIALGQHFIEKNGCGILAFINSNSFLDSPTFRGMRWSLLKIFDSIYILDLHGNAKKKELSPDGGRDENVFDITEGVSINIFVKLPTTVRNDNTTARSDSKGKTATVFHRHLYGKREEKYAFLLKNRLQTVKWKKLKPAAPQYFFVPKDFSLQREYNKGFSVKDLFLVNGVGITTAHDEFVIGDKDVLVKRFRKFKSAEPIPAELHAVFNVKKKEGWNILDGWNNLQKSSSVSEHVKPISYRPFDERHIFYEEKLVWRCVWKVMQHFLKGDNVGLVTCRQAATKSWKLVGITKNIAQDSFVSNQTKERGYVFPLYLYREEVLKNGKERIFETKTPNLNETIIHEIAQRLGLRFTNEKEETKKTFAPIDVFDYIYAVLHSPGYREKYKEFLKIDFPRVPYPDDAKKFWQLVKLGARLRHLHLMEGVEPPQRLADYDVKGSNIVERHEHISGKVWINDTQYFDHVPSEVWNFYIGGYQPAQKWLKDRKGRMLNFDEIQHYRKIICILKETMKVMNEITLKEKD